MSRRAVYFLVIVIRLVNVGSSALDYRDYRFPCGPEDCSESVTCWTDTSKRPLLNCPTSELASTFVDQLQCDVYGREGVTVLQRRTHNKSSVDINRTLFDYETGFGSDGNFWIGLNRIHRLSSRGRNLLTLDLVTYHGHPFKLYPGFWVDDESSGYTMYASRGLQGAIASRGCVAHWNRPTVDHSRHRTVGKRGVLTSLKVVGGSPVRVITLSLILMVVTIQAGRINYSRRI